MGAIPVAPVACERVAGDRGLPVIAFRSVALPAFAELVRADGLTLAKGQCSGAQNGRGRKL